MSSEVQSPLFTLIALSLIVFGLIVVGLVSGLIPGVYPAKSGADAPVAQVETKAEPTGTAVFLDSMGSAMTARPEGATAPVVSDVGLPPTLVAETASKNR